MGSVLIVDDEPDLLSLLAMAFVDQGYDVAVASSGNKAIEALEGQNFDAVISDIRMSDGDGVMLLKHINGSVKRKPLFYFASAFFDVSEKSAIDLGAKGFFQKPYLMREIVQEIGQALGRAIH